MVLARKMHSSAALNAFTVLFGIAVSCCPLSAFGNDDSPRLSEDELISRIESLYRGSDDFGSGPSAPVSTTEDGQEDEGRDHDQIPRIVGCPLGLVREAELNWDNLSDATRDRLAPYLLPPDDARASGINGPAAPETAYEVAQTEHFELRYWTSGTHTVVPTDADNSGLPDYIENAGSYLETAWRREIDEFGFTAPAGPKPVVWFRALQHNGLTHYQPGQAIWIELNADILGYTQRVLGAHFNAERVSRDPEGTQAGLLKAVCAHEFFHAVQAQYEWETPTWWAEGTADWMGHAVFPESGFYLNNIGPHLESPHASLFRKGDFFDYSASIFPVFIHENAGGTTAVRQIWEHVKGSNIYAALPEVLGDIENVYLLFASYNYLKAYKDGDRFPEAPRAIVESYDSVTGPGDIASLNKGKWYRHPNQAPESYGANFHEFRASGSGTLTIRLNPTRGRLKAKLITVDQNGDWKIHPVKPGSRTMEIQVPNFGSTYARCTLVIGNFDNSSVGDYTVEASQ